MCSESLPKEFEKTTEVLPFTTYGLSSIHEFKDVETEIHHLERLKKAGLTYDEIKIYQDNEAGCLDQQKKVEASALKGKLDTIYSKMKSLDESNSSEHEDVPQPSKPNFATNFLNKVRNSLFVYPEGHPMNHIKEIEVDLFGHLQAEDIPPISKRRKMLRRFERKKAHSMQVAIATRGLAIPTSSIDRPHYDHAGNTFWDMDGEEPELEWCPDYMLPSDLPLACKTKHGLPPSNRNDHHPGEKNFNVQSDLRNLRSPKNRNEPIGPRNQHLYTIRDNNIVRLEHVDQDQGDEYRAVDIVVPENPAEEMLLEGTKMSVDNIRKIERFRDYDPGVPSKVLYLKNIAPTVSQEQVSLLFNQFVLANGGPINVRLMTSGRMRGQAFVEFQDEEICIQALSEANGTILSGRPIIAQFARNTNHRPG